MSNENYALAVRHTAQARAINDEFAGKAMPAEAARQMELHLQKARDLRRIGDLEEQERYLAEPQYKHDMTGDGGSVTYGDGTRGPAGDLNSLHNDPIPGLSAKTIRDIAGFVRGTPEGKAALVEDTNGDKLVPADFAGTILKELSREGVIRPQATVRPTQRRTVDVGSVEIGTPTWGKLELGDSAGDGLGEPEKDTITVWDLNALVKIGRDELEDSDQGLVQTILDGVTAKLAEQEDDAFAAGTGDANKQPTGFANGNTVTQKVTAATPGTYLPDDVIHKLVYAVPAWARKNGAFYGNSDAEQAVALFKDGDDHYLWQPVTAEGLPATLRGRPWYTVDGLPSGTLESSDYTAGKPLFFGDMKAAYMIADRRKFTYETLRERYADEGKIGLLFTHRVGGGVLRPKALAYYQV